MNFLAHSYLSPDEPLTMLGNTFGDFVKGKKMEDVNPLLKEGVLLHRRIDHYTDNHPLVKSCIEIFRPVSGRFSAVIVDMCFDYFLAKNWSKFSKVSLNEFVKVLFVKYEGNSNSLTERINKVAPIMKMHEWMLQYQTIEGLKNILTQMSARIKNKAVLQDAIPVLVKNEVQLEQLFDDFFADLVREFKA
ncbi:MAG: acyl carrier protein phosphodiesterase [Saprospiraceae bacterium]|jgi:acyl carrier protein phosphodiesterase